MYAGVVAKNDKVVVLVSYLANKVAKVNGFEATILEHHGLNTVLLGDPHHHVHRAGSDLVLINDYRLPDFTVYTLLKLLEGDAAFVHEEDPLAHLDASDEFHLDSLVLLVELLDAPVRAGLAHRHQLLPNPPSLIGQ